MPSALEYIPPTDSRRNQFGDAVLSERSIRRDLYETALQYYDGEHIQQLDVDINAPDDNVIVNLVKMTADRTSSFLFPKMPTFQTDPNSIEPTPEEIWLKKFYQANGGLERLIKLSLRGFLSGHNFIRVTPPKQKKLYPKMSVLDPRMVTVYWRADDIADVLWYELRYNVGDDIRIQDYVFNEAKNNWLIYTYGSTISQETPMNAMPNVSTIHGKTLVGNTLLDLLSFTDGTSYKQLGDVAIHTSPIPPIIDFAHLPDPDSYYGVGEFNQKKLQDTINRVASEMNRIIRENADPVDVIIGADADEVEDSGNIMTIASPTAKAQRFEMKGDLVGIVNVFERWMEIYLSVARVVLLKGEAKDLQRVTNASVRTLFLDALAKNEILQSTYGFALRQVCQLGLLMGYKNNQIPKNPQDLEITVEFAQPLPTDMLEVANINAIMKSIHARSSRTAATLMGDNWAFESAALAAEQEREMEQKRAELKLEQEFTPEPAITQT